MTPSELLKAKRKRSQLKAAATRLKSYIESFDAQSGSRHDLLERRSKLVNIWEQYETLQSEIECHEDDHASVAEFKMLDEQRSQERSEFENAYFDTVSQYDQAIEYFDDVAGQRSDLSGPKQSLHAPLAREPRVRLPKLDLPVFAGDYKEWYAYRDTFEQIIHSNADLTDVEKFHYLKSTLRGKAADVINSIGITKDGYLEAWRAVRKRYDHRRWIIQQHIRAMREAPAVARGNPAAILELIDTIQGHLRALKALERPTDEWDDLIIDLLLSKLDRSTIEAWDMSLLDDHMPDLNALLDFLSRRCLARETSHFNNISSHPTRNASNPNGKNRGNAYANIAISNLICPLCKGNHYLYQCNRFRNLPVDERAKVVKKAHLCINCLKSNAHQAKSCASGSCRMCNKKHNTFLHQTDTTEGNESAPSEMARSRVENASTSIVAQCVSNYCSSNVLLSTAIVHVYDINNEVIPCRVLLDSGSQLNFITKDLAKRLRLEEQSFEATIKGIVDGSLKANKWINVCVKSRFNNFCENIECVVLPKITQSLPHRFIAAQGLSLPKHVKLADPNFNVPGNIDMLIGAALFWNLLCVGQIRHAKDQPILQKTHFGWVVSGQLPDRRSVPSARCHLAVTDDLSYILNRFWEVEHSGPSPPPPKDTSACEEHFLQHARRNTDGRFVVKLPLRKEGLSNLGDSRNTAMRRYLALEKRLVKQPNAYCEYKRFMQEYKDLGHMHEVVYPLEAISSTPTYYMPHHAVYKETSSTTKLRVVFDASCKSSSGVSLNDTLMVGPVLQDDLFSILAKFRTFRYAITADIAKMYRQVLLDSSQTSLQRILWRDSIEDEVKTFELATVTYGTASASFLAIRALRKLAEDNLEKLPTGARTVLNDFYVDDLVTGANSLQEALDVKRETNQLLLEGRFELRKWMSNEPTLQEDQSSSAEKEFALADNKNCETRTLGIIWNCRSDEFRFDSVNCLPPLEKPTKRTILSRIALIFDPLGLLGPVTLVAKTIMQDLWRLKVDWDESLPLDAITKWRRYEAELPELRPLRIPRRVIAVDIPSRLELHGFSDASEIAYGACIYLRATSLSGRCAVRLLCSKSRVAPLKSLSLPRLELCAALLLAQLVDKLLKRLTRNPDSIYLWSDSTVVLAWIQSCSRTWNSFVANRVGELQQLTAVRDWHHIRSADNPADPLSRGVMPASLARLDLWWTGPPWLVFERGKWPRSSSTAIGTDIPERRSTLATVMTTTETDPEIFERYSDLAKLIRIVAYMFRFLDRARKVATSTRKGIISNTRLVEPVSVVERQRVIECLVKVIQSTSFNKELRSISKHNTTNKNSPILKLNPFIDDRGILRVGGRLKASSLPYSAKHPILLPGRHPFSQLIIRHEHERHLHAGPQATLSAIRQNYWLTSARGVVRQVTRNCITCFRSAPTTSSTIMGDLPETRVSVTQRPFATCGVDYAGPFYHKEGTRRNCKTVKCYIAIFVCFATKAVHIELATDMSSEAFLNVFKRFISRRGCPSNLYSDNGLNFVGAQRQLDELATLLNTQQTCESIKAYMVSRNIQWHFIPPKAPHHGGLWEAAVKSAKRHLLRITKEAHLRYEELQTLVVQIEAILNSRPLTPLSSDPADLTPLTAGHFLIGTPLTAYPEPELIEVPMNRLSRWQRVEQLRQGFWKRWSHEYLHQCQQRSKWQSQDMTAHKGQMVILKEDNTPPLLWPLGRIVDVHPGQDGLNRVVSVRTAKGIYKRPITRLCLLPIHELC